MVKNIFFLSVKNASQLFSHSINPLFSPVLDTRLIIFIQTLTTFCF